MGDETEVAGGGDFGIELFDSPCTGVSGVHEEIVTCFFAFFVDAFELGKRDVDFASDFEYLWDEIGIEFEGERVDGSNGVGDIVALLPITSGECADEDAIFVADGKGYAVDFGFADEFGFRG